MRLILHKPTHVADTANILAFDHEDANVKRYLNILNVAANLSNQTTLKTMLGLAPSKIPAASACS